MGNTCCAKDSSTTKQEEFKTVESPEPLGEYEGLTMRELMLVIKVQSRVRGLITRNKIKAA